MTIVEMRLRKKNGDTLEKPSSAEIAAFWKWFSREASNLSELINQSSTCEIAELIGPRITALNGRIGWEIGPGITKDCAFSFSFNGDLRNRPTIESIVESAPEFVNWEFNIGKPPKVWDGRFILRNQEGTSLKLDASNWRYVLTSFDNGSFFDIGLIARLPLMDEKAKMHAASVAIEGVVGEKVFLERFGKSEFLDTPNHEDME